VASGEMAGGAVPMYLFYVVKASVVWLPITETPEVCAPVGTIPGGPMEPGVDF